MSTPSEVPLDDEGEVVPETVRPRMAGAATSSPSSRGRRGHRSPRRRRPRGRRVRGRAGVELGRAGHRPRGAPPRGSTRSSSGTAGSTCSSTTPGSSTTRWTSSRSDPEQWWHVQEVNVLGAYLMTWLVAPHMLAAGGGRVVNLNSGAARRAGATRAPTTSARPPWPGSPARRTSRGGHAASGPSTSCRGWCAPT